MVARLEFDPLQVEHDVGHVLDYARESGKFMLRAGDFHRGDRSAFERGKQDAAKRIADRVAVAGFKGFGDKLRVGFRGAVLVFDEGLRHFKTTVMNWHTANFRMSNLDFRLKTKRLGQSKSENLNSKFLLSAGLPLTSAASRLATETQGPTAQLQKLAAGRE